MLYEAPCRQFSGFDNVTDLPHIGLEVLYKLPDCCNPLPEIRECCHPKIKIKSYLNYTRLIPFRVSRVSGAHFRGFAPRSTHQGCSGGESLATCGRFDRLGIWTPYLPLAPSGRNVSILNTKNVVCKNKSISTGIL